MKGDLSLVEKLELMLADWENIGIAELTTNVEAVRAAITALRAVREAPVGELIACSFEDERPVWHVMDDREAVPLMRGRVRLVIDTEGG